MHPLRLSNQHVHIDFRDVDTVPELVFVAQVGMQLSTVTNRIACSRTAGW
jgi:hypothetical protein